MEVYFYCSYEHSQKGFFMTQLTDGQLRPVTMVPELVESFFSYDRFQLLWYDMCSQQSQRLWKPQAEGMFFGIRNLRGEMADGRGCTANLLFLADADEIPALRRIALSVLGDYPAFERQLTGWLSVGGHSYDLRVDAFSGWMESCACADHLTRFSKQNSLASKLLFRMQRVEEPMLENELLRLAVYTSDWRDVQQIMGQSLAWKLKPGCAMTPAEFEAVFMREAPLWELSAD